MGAKIYPAARERLLQIWDYTERKWGEEQADAYVETLVAAAHALPQHRAQWRLCAESDIQACGSSAMPTIIFSFAS